MAEAIDALVFDRPLRDQLVAAGKERALGFTWDKMVDRTLQAYGPLLHA